MTGVTGKPELMKRMNTTLLYRTLIRLGSATRAEVANETNLSATTIRNLFEELEAGGEIVAGALDRSSGGRRAQRYALNPARNLTLALYCAGERIDYRITGLTGDVAADSFAPIEDGDTVEAVLRLIADCRSRWDVRAVGLGVPASWRTGAPISAANWIPWSRTTSGRGSVPPSPFRWYWKTTSTRPRSVI